MTRISIIMSLTVLFWNTSFSQNLIPNGSFENAPGLEYSYPHSAFPFLDFWYPANFFTVDTLYGGSPDLFDNNNHVPASTPTNFWNAATGAADGDFHTGIANHVLYEGYFQPEAMGTSLTQPLSPNTYYHIELHSRNKGVSGYQGKAPVFCVTDEDKRIDILLDPDSIFVTVDIQEKASYSDVDKVLSLRSNEMSAQLLGEWQKVGTCFEAGGGEKFLAVTLPTGFFSVDPPCVIHDEHWDAFYVYYFDIDDVKLTKLPEQYTVNQTICAGRQTKINIADLAGLPVMQNEIQYHWHDGKVDSVNHISKAGTYHIDAVLDCKTIPITLEVTDTECDPTFVVPNIFTPNQDGENDYLTPVMIPEIPLIEYQFSVFDRWGTRVFSTNDINTFWDGTFQGKDVSSGVYIWFLDYVVEDIQRGIIQYTERGDVAIIR